MFIAGNSGTGAAGQPERRNGANPALNGAAP
jgi:hypothetical protein